MFVDNSRLFFIVAIFGLTLSASPSARSDTPEPSLSPIRPTLEAAGDAYRQAGCDHARTADCIALETIFDTDRVFIDATATPMKIGMPNAKGWAIVRRMTRPSLIRRRLRQVFLNHPKRFPVICARIKSFASLYDKEDVRNSHGYLIVKMIQMATLMDTKSHNHCLPEVLAALPHTPDADDQVEIARDFCKDSQWATPACKRIAR